jgi:hypothetical protein
VTRLPVQLPYSHVLEHLPVPSDFGSIKFIVPTHPARLANGMAQRAISSIRAQTLPCQGGVMPIDEDGNGAALTRQDGLDAIESDWVCFLDSDDEMMSEHLRSLAGVAAASGADYVYSWYMIKDADGRERPEWDFMAENFGQPFDPKRPVQTTITTLVRTELAKAVGFLNMDGPPTPDGNPAGEDWRFTLGCIAQGATIVHAPWRTWYWYHHGRNSSGQPGRGDA